MLMVVVALFTLAWLPLQLYDVLNQMVPEINMSVPIIRIIQLNPVPRGSMLNFRYPYINIIWFCMHWLAMSNSCYNPFIYLLCNVSLLSLTEFYPELQDYFTD